MLSSWRTLTDLHDWPPKAVPAMLELLAMDQFIDLLTDEDIQQNQPENLQQAIEAALELESYQLASRQRARTVCAAQLDCEHENTPTRLQRRTRSTGVHPDVLEKCSAA